jgi:hypothetical protein
MLLIDHALGRHRASMAFTVALATALGIALAAMPVAAAASVTKKPCRGVDDIRQHRQSILLTAEREKSIALTNPQAGPMPILPLGLNRDDSSPSPKQSPQPNNPPVPTCQF